MADDQSKPPPFTPANVLTSGTNPYHVTPDSVPMSGTKPYHVTPDNVPMSGANPYHVGYDQPVAHSQGFYVAPQNPTVVQTSHATGTTTSSNTTVVLTQPREFIMVQTRQSDLTIPAVLVCVLCCWCVGIPAIIYASNAQSLYNSGNVQEAESSQRKARGWILATVLSHFVAWGVALTVYYTVFAAAAHEFNKDFGNN